ncbi:retrovirus-related Pol polyprotein from transposon 17.6 [Trichonephila clavipes]|nr:retrovirus-related Pol polyprotein from transposon 17.6 [Trichonephila clavipes]
MGIILKDDIPVYQAARRLSYVEKQIENKDIEELLEQGIIRPSSSEYANDVLDRLQEAKVYTTLDLKNGFFHVDVNEDCRKFTSFIVPDGQFEFNKVPFGLSTSPSVFQRYINSIFRNLMNEGLIIIYMDDLIIPSADEEEGLRNLRTVLEVASKYGLEIQFKKCQFLKRKVEFLGHIVENGTISPLL